jgi:hypothetical protein
VTISQEDFDLFYIKKEKRGKGLDQDFQTEPDAGGSRL